VLGVATVRELESFAAQFLLTDDGELKKVSSTSKRSLICALTKYPMLNSPPGVISRAVAWVWYWLF
jgi:hypothetical protein